MFRVFNIIYLQTEDTYWMKLQVTIIISKTFTIYVKLMFQNTDSKTVNKQLIDSYLLSTGILPKG